MNPESYILLMISGWLLLSAALLWAMLRLVHRHQLEAQLAAQEQNRHQPQTASARRKQHAPRRARVRERVYRHLPQQHAH
ncbi:hypothetical protein [Phytopseudomonas dryadis]|uniref:Histidine kinase n=1 Tax=Phytopseudomonas dryadis TaxID=2487520 RepID=A0ABY1Z1D4_9GAMM|nr:MULTISPECIES: hypothetical protein [Pseudomonas]TBV01516.1 hypothetical protein DNK34_20975 [Pseudomonas dryadis]TBV19411.1 hypothetical protein DNK41_02430 [Pseudomonas sp. FRB 230]